ncbi:hypothetical protein ACJTM1_17595 [Bacillus sp. GX]|nr:MULTISPECIES: hypothetical protein [Bacillus]MDA1852371.1 hypothetical protein [Bacillus cereus]MDA2028300.1 hypothetical protein [Bacillus cereus group sp. Bcc03]MDA2714952.1 hypothetical protein [Bacillus cereus group sp. Bc025]MDC6155097.1 hypothetical protein [Bacillus albus]MDD8004574.1 hypothetical protein [Bacillus albus]
MREADILISIQKELEENPQANGVNISQKSSLSRKGILDLS